MPMAPLGVEPSKPPWGRSSPPEKLACGYDEVPPPPTNDQPASPLDATSVAGFRPFSPLSPLSPLSPFCGAEPWSVVLDPVSPLSPLSPFGPGVPVFLSVRCTPLDSLSDVIVPFLMSRPWIVPSLIFAEVISEPAAAVPVHAKTTAMDPRTTPGLRCLRIHP